MKTPKAKSKYFAVLYVPVEIEATTRPKAKALAGKLSKALKARKLSVATADEWAKVLNNNVHVESVAMIKRIVTDRRERQYDIAWEEPKSARAGNFAKE